MGNFKVESLINEIKGCSVYGIEYLNQACNLLVCNQLGEYRLIHYNGKTGEIKYINNKDMIDSINSFGATLNSKVKDATKNQNLDLRYFDFGSGKINCVFYSKMDQQLYALRGLNERAISDSNITCPVELEKIGNYCLIKSLNKLDNCMLSWVNNSNCFFVISRDGGTISETYSTLTYTPSSLYDLLNCISYWSLNPEIATVSTIDINGSKLICINASLNSIFPSVQRKQFMQILREIRKYITGGTKNIILMVSFSKELAKFLSDDVLNSYGLQIIQGNGDSCRNSDPCRYICASATYGEGKIKVLI